MRKIASRIIFTLLAMILTACSDNIENDSSSTSTSLRIGPLPDRSAEQMKKDYQPLLEYLEQKTGLKTELVIAKSYVHLVELFDSKKIDMANFGGVTYIKAHQKNKAIPLVLRDVDEKFSSVVLVRSAAPARRLEDLANQSFAFGSRLSTSGHLMPRYFFKQKDINPETSFKSVRYSGAHDKTAYWVRDKEVYAGVSNASIVKQMYQDGRLKASEVRILWETPHYTDYVWAIQNNFPKHIRYKVRDAFLELNATNPQQKIILSKLGAAYYMPASHEQFATLETIMANLTAKGVLND